MKSPISSRYLECWDYLCKFLLLYCFQVVNCFHLLLSLISYSSILLLLPLLLYILFLIDFIQVYSCFIDNGWYSLWCSLLSDLESLKNVVFLSIMLSWAHCTCTPMARKEFVHTHLALSCFSLALFFFVLVCFALCFHVGLVVHLLETRKGLTWGKLMYSFWARFDSVDFHVL